MQPRSKPLGRRKCTVPRALTCFAIGDRGDCDAVGDGRVGEVEGEGVDELGRQRPQPSRRRQAGGAHRHGRRHKNGPHLEETKLLYSCC